MQVFLEENLDRDVDLRTIAREAALSPYYFTRQFTAYVGVPPYRYLIGLRIDRAKDLLRESEFTVTQICHRVGFNSLSHFTTTFRQHTGVSPPRTGVGATGSRRRSASVRSPIAWCISRTSG